MICCFIQEQIGIQSFLSGSVVTTNDYTVSNADLFYEVVILLVTMLLTTLMEAVTKEIDNLALPLYSVSCYLALKRFIFSIR